MASVLASSPMSATSFKSPARCGARHALMEIECEPPTGVVENYTASQSHVTQWRRDVTQAVGSEVQRGLRELCRERTQLVDLRADLTNAQGLVAAAAKLKADGERLAETVERSARVADERSQAIACVRDELTLQRDANIEALRHEKDQVEMQRTLKAQRQREIEKLLGTYLDRLGLTITRHAPQTVRMAFTLIDLVDPAREFAFTLGVSESSLEVRYEVQECSPSVPQLPDLLSELNGTVNGCDALPRFVCSMRRAFLKLACPCHHKL